MREKFVRKIDEKKMKCLIEKNYGKKKFSLFRSTIENERREKN